MQLLAQNIKFSFQLNQILIQMNSFSYFEPVLLKSRVTLLQFEHYSRKIQIEMFCKRIF